MVLLANGSVPTRAKTSTLSAPTGAALLNSLEDYVQRAAGGGSGEPRGPFKDEWNPLQYGTNNAAFTLVAPINDGFCILNITNGAAAGAITFTGFNVSAAAGTVMRA